MISTPQMRISDFVFARTAPSAFQRPLIVVSVIICVIWTTHFDRIVFNIETLLVYLISLVIAAFVAPTALGVYFYLPPLGKNRRWEKLLIILGALIFIGLMAWTFISGTNFDGGKLLPGLAFFLFLTFVPSLTLKILVWLWQGVRGQGK